MSRVEGKSEPGTDQLPAATFAQLLRRHRQRACLTQEELAERANVSVRAISDLERGAKQGPHRTTVELLAAALGLSADERAVLDGSVRRTRGPLRAVPVAPLSRSKPTPLTPLVGRRRDVEEAVHLIRWGGVRLLTLTGPGGVGKTRVAMAATQAMQDDCVGGPTYVALAPVRDTQLVGRTVATALGLRETGGHTVEETLIRHLRERSAIIVLDNFEHVLPAAALLSSLLAECPRLKVVVTSRTALRLQGEHRMEVAPLEMPDHEALAHLDVAARYPAVELFVQRARAASRTFALTDENLATVIEICRRLDGLPLAIELAAARLAHLTPQALLIRLSRRLTLLTDGPSDLPVRQQTMRNTIAWSYELLAQPHQRLLRHLSVFAGGWSLEAAEAVAGTWEGGERFAVFGELSALIDASLVVVDDLHAIEPRYRMLETIREYASEQLAARGEGVTVHRLHADYFVALAEQAEPQLTGPDQAQWLDRLGAEHNNVRAALDWTRAAGDVERGARLTAALWRFWLNRGLSEEGRGWARTFLAMLGELASPLLRARLHYAAGALAFGQALHNEAEPHFETALTLFRAVGDTEQVAVTLNGLGVIASGKGEYARALPLLRESVALHRQAGNETFLAAPLLNIATIVRYQARDAETVSEAIALYEEGIDIHRRHGNVHQLATSLNNLALVLLDGGDFERAADLATESLALGKRVASPGLQAAALTTLSVTAIDQGEDERARPLTEAGLELFRRSGDRDMIGTNLVNLGTLELRGGRVERAEALAREALALFQQTGAQRLLGYAFENLGDVARARGDLKQARACYDESLAVRREVGYVAGVAISVERLASVACAEGAWDLAARQYGAAAALRDRLGVPAPPVARDENERNLARIREMLGEVPFAAAWEDGLNVAAPYLRSPAS